ncbi:MAG: ribose-phosphate diphosphokinase [Acetobacter sp.]|nr:ribose-phosphate diphosphokinase [Acetobacter sp.]
MINLLSSVGYGYLKRALLESGEFNDVEIETKVFPDGEHYFRIIKPEQISGKPAVYICGTVDDAAIMEAYNLCCTLVREGCSSLHLVLPYFGYSTMERAIKTGEVVSAKNIARLFSSVPVSAMGNFIYMVDLHSLGTQYYFEQNIHPVHLTTEPVIDKMIADIRATDGEVVLASADMGRAKWIEKMSNRLGIGGAYIMKKRISGSETVVEALNADVQGKNVIIFDDMIRSGSSIINAAQAYKSIGAKDIYVACVHGVFVDGAIDKLKNSGVIKAVYCTNTHAKTQLLNDDFVKVYDMSEVIFRGLKR